jgi:predicted dehydrogenase/threonine dehydrogenase-like Zn-dependent dehydrogenase
MLQVLRRGLKDIVVEEVPEPTVGRGEVKIGTAYSVISSGTEIAGLHTNGLAKEVIREREKIRTLIGRVVKEQGIIKTAQGILDKFKELSITGYSGAGVVIEKSSEIMDLEMGQRVAYGGIQAGHAEIVCTPRNLVAPVPEGVGLKDASLTTIGSIALHAVRNANITIGDSVAIIGLGLIGQLVIQLVQLAGARVFGIDIRKARLDLSLKQGAEVALDANKNPKQFLDILTDGQGADSVIICASSQTSQPLEMALDIARSRARVIVVGSVKMEMPREVLYRKELQLMVSRAYGPGSYDALYEKKGIDYPIDYVRWTENRNMGEFLRLLKEGKIHTEHVISHEFAVQEAPVVFQKLASGEEGIIGAVLRYTEVEEKDTANKTTIQLPVPSRRTPSQSDKLKVGIIGLGNIARWVHLPNVSKHPKLILKGVCTPKGYKAKHLGIRFRSEYCSTDYQQVLRDPDINLVIICTRHDLHFRIAMEALKAGKHVFVEKPMAMTREDCSRLVTLVRETGLGFMVNFNRRYSPIYQMANAAVSGRGPKIISVRMNSPDILGSSWITDPVEGGGVVLGEGCHFFDLMAWLTESEPISVFARNLFPLEDNLASENNLVCTISFQDGSVGSFVYETVGNRGLGSERVEISAAGISAVVKDMKRLSVWDESGSRVKRKKSLRPDKGYYNILNAFIEAILRGQNFEKEAIAGARATLCALAALRSIETDLPQKLGVS